MNKKLGKYNVLEEIGRGGMAVVYRARQESLDRIVAIKELDLSRAGPDPKALERFQLEARAAASLDHPSIITVHDFWERSNKAYIAMEFVDGLELKEALAVAGTLEPMTAVRIGISLCKALSYAHERGIVHRDVKPGNVMLSAQGSVKLADFGIVLVSGSADLTTTGQVIGTPSFMSPEQIKGEPVGPPSDIFSLGVVLYETLTGVKPFTGPSDVAVTHAIVRSRPVRIRKRNPRVPRRLVRVIMKSLRKKPTKRFATMDEMAAALERSLVRRAPSTAQAVSALVASVRLPQGGQEVTMPLAVESTPAAKKSRVFLLLLPAAVLILALVLWPREPPPEPGLPGGTAPSPAAVQTVPVTVIAYPWAEILLDGKSQGYTPRARPLAIAPGRHTMVLRNPHLGKKTVTLDLKAGVEETVTVDLAEGQK
ncbi:MAG: serine/threonine-protein kinase [bacterium]|nr:serine/threonine-protein kinase [bacterium]